MIFGIGDKVKIVDIIKLEEGFLKAEFEQYIGEEGEIVEVLEDDEYPYGIAFDGEEYPEIFCTEEEVSSV